MRSLRRAAAKASSSQTVMLSELHSSTYELSSSTPASIEDLDSLAQIPHNLESDSTKSDTSETLYTSNATPSPNSTDLATLSRTTPPSQSPTQRLRSLLDASKAKMIAKSSNRPVKHYGHIVEKPLRRVLFGPARVAVPRALSPSEDNDDSDSPCKG